ncbi:hypothetical protein [Streptomyces sp. NPDC101237]|uniref:hypothetical protein n=1 Tax=Streptomyces sp. NPDC101237 TaxID=3366139 RepID=UPI00381E059A
MVRTRESAKRSIVSVSPARISSGIVAGVLQATQVSNSFARSSTPRITGTIRVAGTPTPDGVRRIRGE